MNPINPLNQNQPQQNFNTPPPPQDWRSQSYAPQPTAPNNIQPVYANLPSPTTASLGQHAVSQHQIEGYEYGKPVQIDHNQPKIPKTTSKSAKGGTSIFKKILFALAIIIVLGLLAGGAYVAYKSFFGQTQTAPSAQNTQAELFAESIEKNMTLTNFRRTVTANIPEYQSNELTTVDSDFSDPSKPKIKGNIRYDVLTVDSKTARRSADFIDVSDNRQYWRLNVFDKQADAAKQTQLVSIRGKWVVYDIDKAPEDRLVPEFMQTDQTLATRANTIQGNLIMGNLSASVRKEIMDYISKNDIYRIQKFEVTKYGGRPSNKFTVNVNEAEIKNLNSFVAGKTKSKAVKDAGLFPVSDFTYWADSETFLPQKVEYSYVGVNTEMVYSNINQAVEIKVPAIAPKAPVSDTQSTQPPTASPADL